MRLASAVVEETKPQRTKDEGAPAPARAAARFTGVLTPAAGTEPTLQLLSWDIRYGFLIYYFSRNQDHFHRGDFSG